MPSSESSHTHEASGFRHGPVSFFAAPRKLGMRFRTLTLALLLFLALPRPPARRLAVSTSGSRRPLYRGERRRSWLVPRRGSQHRRQPRSDQPVLALRRAHPAATPQDPADPAYRWASRRGRAGRAGPGSGCPADNHRRAAWAEGPGALARQRSGRGSPTPRPSATSPPPPRDATPGPLLAGLERAEPRQPSCARSGPGGTGAIRRRGPAVPEHAQRGLRRVEERSARRIRSSPAAAPRMETRPASGARGR